MRIDKNSRFLTRPIAHRGLWGNGIIENSLTAYKNAVDNGYPIEIDLYLSTDGVLYSFHDKTLTRMTGVDGLIYEKNSEFLDSLRLLNSDEKIPTFDEVLKTVDGKVPILIEIKNQPNELAVDLTVERLKSYDGEFMIQSFNPLYIKRLKKIAPEIRRGILSTGVKEELKGEKSLTRFIVKNMALNFLIKPDFISYDYRNMPLKKRKIKGKAVFAWTLTDEENYKKIKGYCDNIIFENFIPKL